jgi:hypothetical protein
VAGESSRVIRTTCCSKCLTSYHMTTVHHKSTCLTSRRRRPAEHNTWVDQGLSVLGSVERSTGDVRQNSWVSVSHAVACEQRANQFGLVSLRSRSDIRFIHRPTCCRFDGHLSVYQQLRWSAALWTAVALLFARHPRAASQGGELCSPGTPLLECLRCWPPFERAERAPLLV